MRVLREIKPINMKKGFCHDERTVKHWMEQTLNTSKRNKKCVPTAKGHTSQPVSTLRVSVRMKLLYWQTRRIVPPVVSCRQCRKTFSRISKSPLLAAPYARIRGYTTMAGEKKFVHREQPSTTKAKSANQTQARVDGSTQPLVENIRQKPEQRFPAAHGRRGKSKAA